MKDMKKEQSLSLFLILRQQSQEGLGYVYKAMSKPEDISNGVVRVLRQEQS